MRGAALGAAGSARSTLLSWRAILSEREFHTFKLVLKTEAPNILDGNGKSSYPVADGAAGCGADFSAAGVRLVITTASSATGGGPEPGLTVASLLAGSV